MAVRTYTFLVWPLHGPGGPFYRSFSGQSLAEAKRAARFAGFSTTPLGPLQEQRRLMTIGGAGLVKHAKLVARKLGSWQAEHDALLRQAKGVIEEQVKQGPRLAPGADLNRG